MLIILNYTKLLSSVVDPNYGVTQVAVEAQIRVAQTKVVIVAFVMAAHRVKFTFMVIVWLRLLVKQG
jgi:hypothetical protein